MSTREQKFYFFSIIFIPLVIANLRMKPTVPGYYYFSLSGLIPKEIPFLLVIIVILYFYIKIIIRTNSLNSIFLVSAIVGLTIVGSVIQGGELADLIYGYIILLPPILIYYTIVNIDNCIYDYQTILRWFFIIGFANIIPALFTFLFYGQKTETHLDIGSSLINSEDVVNGFLSDAHQFAFFMFFLGFLAFAQWRSLGKPRSWFLIMLSFFIMGSLGFNEKLIYLTILFIMVIGLIKLFKKQPLISTAIFTVIVLTSGILIQEIKNWDWRFESLLDNQFSELPFVSPFAGAVKVFSDKPSTMLIGAGLGNYGSPVAVSQTARNGKVPNFAKGYVENALLVMAMPDYQSLEGSIFSNFQIPLMTFTNYVIELGIPCSFLFYFFFIRIFIFKRKQFLQNQDLRHHITILRYFFVLCLFYSMISIYGTFDDYISIIPQIILIAFLHNNRGIVVQGMNRISQSTTLLPRTSI